MNKASIDVPLPDDAYLVYLTRFTPIMTQTTEKIYQSKPQSSLLYWKSAVTIYQGLKALGNDLQRDFGIKLEALTTSDSHGAPETLLITRKLSFWFLVLHENRP
jgi:hypothetical protein